MYFNQTNTLFSSFRNKGVAGGEGSRASCRCSHWNQQMTDSFSVTSTRIFRQDFYTIRFFFKFCSTSSNNTMTEGHTTCTAVIKSYFESYNGFISGEVVIFFCFAHSLVGSLNTGRLRLCKSLREICKPLLQLHTEGQLLHKVGTTVSLSFFRKVQKLSNAPVQRHTDTSQSAFCQSEVE